METPCRVFLLLFGIVTVCHAQTFRGGISGRVVDSTGAVLPGVTVIATNNATGVSQDDELVGDRRFLDDRICRSAPTPSRPRCRGSRRMKVTVEVTRVAGRRRSS